MNNCICGSEKAYDFCCKPYIEEFYKHPIEPEDLLVYSWVSEFSNSHLHEFEKIFNKYLFRLSHYYNHIESIGQNVSEKFAGKEFEVFNGIQLNIRHSILAAITASGTGLFLQGGIILRSAVEDILVLFDLTKNNTPVELIIENKYKISSLVSRIKDYL